MRFKNLSAFFCEFSQSVVFRFVIAVFILGVFQHAMVIAYSDYPLTLKNLTNMSYGVAYDFFVASMAASVLLGLFFIPLAGKKIVALFFFWAISFLMYADIQYFYIFGTHIPFANTQYFENTADFSATIVEVMKDSWFFVFNLLFPALFYWFLRTAKERTGFVNNFFKNLGYFFIVLIVGGASASYSNSAFSKNFHDPIVSNGFLYFVATYNDGVVQYYKKPEEALRVIETLLHTENRAKGAFPSEYPLVRHENYVNCKKKTAKSITGKSVCDIYPRGSTPNIMFIFLESFRAQELGAYGGDPAISKGFDALAKEGILFKNFFANGYRTRNAQVAAYCSLMPNFGSSMSIMRRYRNNDYACLPQILKRHNYETAFFIGLNADFDFQNVFFKRIGFDRVIEEADFDPDAETLGWGYSDEELYDKMIDELDTIQEPFFVSSLSATNHHPFDVPKAYQTGAVEYSDKFYESMRYTSDQVYNFIKKIQQKPWYENTIIFIFSDTSIGIKSKYHDYNYNRLDVKKKLPRRNHAEFLNVEFHIPLLIIGGRIPGGIVETEYAGQIDLAPTVADIIGMRGYTHWAGQSLLTKKKPAWAFLNRHGTYFSLIGDEFRLFVQDNNGTYDYFTYGNGGDEKTLPNSRYRTAALSWIKTQQWLLQENKIWDKSIGKRQGLRMVK